MVFSLVDLSVFKIGLSLVLWMRCPLKPSLEVYLARILFMNVDLLRDT